VNSGEKKLAMFWVARQRYQESLKPEDLARVNRLCDEGIFPSMERTKGVKSVRAYDSFRGDGVILAKIGEPAAVEGPLVNREFNPIVSGMFDDKVPSDGDIWLDRKSGKQCFGRKG
jgi:hypothetical protein